MKYVSTMDSAVSAWDRMMNILFRPFNLGKWFVIGFTAWLAEMQLQLNFPSSWGDGGSGGFRSPKGFSGNLSPEAMLQLVKDNPLVDFIIGLGLVFIVAIVMLIILVGIVFLWLNSRGKFMFIWNLAGNRAEVVAPWRDFSQQGNSLFVWQIVIGLVLLVPALLLGLVMLLTALPCFKANDFNAAALSIIISAAVVLILYLIGVAIYYFLLNSVVVPIMFKKKLAFLPAIGEFSRIFIPNLFTFVKFAVLYLILEMLAGMILLTLAIVILCVCCCMCCVIMVLLALPYISTVVILPVLAYFRLFSLEVLARIDPGLDCFAPPAPAQAPAP